MTHLTQPIGLLGGTFDPVHYGHLRIALELQQACRLAEVRFIPCRQPVHRPPAIATPEQRLAMLTRAIKNEPTFTIDECELQRNTPSYMVETIELLRDSLPCTPLCLIVGVDSWIGFAEWEGYEKILELAHLIIAERPAYALPQNGTIATLLKKHLKPDASALHESLGGHIIFHPVTPLAISATAIRQQIAQRQNPRYLLPDSVYDYITEHSIYR